MSPFPLPKYFAASAEDARGFPRVEGHIYRYIDPPPRGGVIQRLMDRLRGNVQPEHNPELLDVTLENKGTRWPDFIGGHVSDEYGLLVSERVLESLHRHGIGGFKPIPVEFTRMPAKLAAQPIPRYHGLRPIAKMPHMVHVFDYENGVLQPLGSYSSQGPVPEAFRWKVGRCTVRQILDSPEDENRLFGGVFRGVGFSRKVVEMAFREKWTNLEFKAYNTLYLSGVDGHYIPNVPCINGCMEDTWYPELQHQVASHVGW